MCVFSVNKPITDHCPCIWILLFCFFSQNVLDRIYQRPRINAIAPRDQSQRVQINGPFARAGHMVQNQIYWRASCAVGIPKQRQVHCFERPNVQFATLRAVGFSYAKRERNHCEQPSAFPSSMRELVTPHVMHLMPSSFVNNRFLL